MNITTDFSKFKCGDVVLVKLNPAHHKLKTRYIKGFPHGEFNDYVEKCLTGFKVTVINVDGPTRMSTTFEVGQAEGSSSKGFMVLDDTPWGAAEVTLVKAAKTDAELAFEEAKRKFEEAQQALLAAEKAVQEGR